MENSPGHEHQHGGAASKLVKLAFAFFTLIVVASYTACLTALLIQQKAGSTLTIETIEADKGKKLCLISAAKGDFLLWRPSFSEARVRLSFPSCFVLLIC